MSLFKKAETTRYSTPHPYPLPVWWGRFWHHVDKGPIAECWNWTASTRKGYGRIRVGANRQVSAHRLIMTHEFGHLPSGAVVRHQCDNPRCVNPTHLWLGSHRDNMADKKARGNAKGERNGRALLTKDQAETIKASREPLDVLAERYAVSNSTIQAIRYGRNWRV